MSRFDTLVEFLNAEDVGFEQLPEDKMVRFNFAGDAGTWFVLGQIFDEAERLAFLSILPSVVPTERRAAVGEFVNRVNFGLVVGNFELDMDEGEVRFRTAMDLDDVDLSVEMVRNLLYANVYMTNAHLVAMNKMVHGDMSPVEALAFVQVEPLDEA